VRTNSKLATSAFTYISRVSLIKGNIRQNILPCAKLAAQSLHNRAHISFSDKKLHRQTDPGSWRPIDCRQKRRRLAFICAVRRDRAALSGLCNVALCRCCCPISDVLLRIKFFISPDTDGQTDGRTDDSFMPIADHAACRLPQ